MKNIKILLATLFVGGMALTSCDNDPVLPPIVGAPTMLETNMDGFTVEDVENPDNYAIWTWSDQYGAVAKGNQHVSDTYLVSPVVTLGTEPVCTFSQAINYLASDREKYINVCVREVYSVDGDDIQAGDWTEVTVDKWPAGTSWTFNDSNADLSEFANKTVQLGFHYVSTKSIYGTWEIKSLKIY